MSTSPLQLTVSGFENGGDMPSRFATVAGGGENRSPAVQWKPLPAAQSYALLFDDKHPIANNWVHWLVVDIPNTVTEIPEGASRVNMPEGSRELMTSWGKTGYDGPQPPISSGSHEYVMRLYALDVPKLDLMEDVSRAEFMKAVGSHTIVEETYSGRFERR
jgi:Raf kinase inhibitor-like YbhB/YbcL family protein